MKKTRGSKSLVWKEMGGGFYRQIEIFSLIMHAVYIL